MRSRTLCLGLLSLLPACAPRPRLVEDVTYVGFDATAARDAPSDRPALLPLLRDGDLSFDPEAGVCARLSVSTARRAPAVLLVLDRSGSMDECSSGAFVPWDAPNCATRQSVWDVAVAALNRMLAAMPDDTVVGLLSFAGDELGPPVTRATFETPDVPLGLLSGTRAAIQRRLAVLRPGGSTPMACALPPALDMLQVPDAPWGTGHVLLLTDGAPTFECANVPGCDLVPSDLACVSAEDLSVRTQVRTAVANAFAGGTRVFAIGTATADTGFLGDLARRGGTARSPTCMQGECAYSLSQEHLEADLDTVLTELRGRVQSCTFDVDTRVVGAYDPNLVNVSLYPGDGAPGLLVRRDASHADGWDWSANRRAVVLYGSACEQLRGNQRAGSSVQIVLGCPTYG